MPTPLFPAPGRTAAWRRLCYASLVMAGLATSTAGEAGVPVRIGVPPMAAGGAELDVVVGEPRLSFSALFGSVNTYTGERYVDHWEAGGAAMVHENFVRLTSDAQGHRGWITNPLPVTAKSWSVLLKFRVSGQDSQLYGDGMALWLVQNSNHDEGNVFGREDRWNGLGVFFDTFQNLDKAHHHKHPYVSAVLNDGTKHYEPQDDLPVHTPSRAQHVIPGRTEGSGCSFDFRFSEARDDFSVLNGTWAHLVYDEGRLKIALRQTSSDRWVECIDLDAPGLENEHYLGLSAATGDLVDNHDVLSFSVNTWDRPITKNDIENLRTKTLADVESRALGLESANVVSPNDENHLKVIEEQAAELLRLRTTVAVLQHRIEYELSAVRKGLQHAKQQAEHGAEKLERLQSEVIAGLSSGLGYQMDRRLEDVTEGVKDQLERFEKNAGTSTFQYKKKRRKKRSDDLVPCPVLQRV